MAARFSLTVKLLPARSRCTKSRADLGILCIHTNSETSSLSADPKLFGKNTFRCARQGIHDAVARGLVRGEACEGGKGLKRWLTCSPDSCMQSGQHGRVPPVREGLRDLPLKSPDQLWPQALRAGLHRKHHQGSAGKATRAVLFSALGGWRPDRLHRSNPISIVSSRIRLSSPPTWEIRRFSPPSRICPRVCIPATVTVRTSPPRQKNKAFCDEYVKSARARTDQLGMAELRRRSIRHRSLEAYRRQGQTAQRWPARLRA